MLLFFSCCLFFQVVLCVFELYVLTHVLQHIYMSEYLQEEEKIRQKKKQKERRDTADRTCTDLVHNGLVMWSLIKAIQDTKDKVKNT